MRTKPNPAFTLIEVLASMSVLVVLMTVMSQIVGMVGTTSRTGKARIDSFTQARTTFWALDRDLQRIVLRPDLAAFADETGTTGALAFYTRVQGGEGDRSVSLVKYEIQNPTTEPRLVRCDYGLDFGSVASPRAPSYGNNSALPDLANVEARELALGVIRLEWKFIDGTGAEQNRFLFDYNAPNSELNTRIVRLSMLVLDSASYDQLLDAGELSTLLSETGGPSENGESRGKHWERLINSSALSGKVPPPVLKSLRVFERSINIPVNQ